MILSGSLAASSLQRYTCQRVLCIQAYFVPNENELAKLNALQLPFHFHISDS
uniref:Uncharacterized protein n=1 Tax=Anguilla anguilla TaxID=7936 RepID=A0A0E9PVR4_ANGAN